MAQDILKVLQEVRGTGAPEAPYTDGIYWDLTINTHNGHAGKYGDIVAKHAEILANSANVTTWYDSIVTMHDNVVTKEASATASALAAGQSEAQAAISAQSAANSAIAVNNDKLAILAAQTDITSKHSDVTIMHSETSTNATNAGISANSASQSATSAQASATSATTSATTASTAASSAQASEVNAVNAASNAQTSEFNAATSASSANASATSAATSLAGAQTAESNSLANASTTAAHLTAIETIYDTFDDRYLGVYALDPILDNDGNALQIGAMYFNSTDNTTRFYNGISWENPEVTASQAASSALTSANAASVSAAAALSSETAAALSATNASTSETNASISEANAAISETNAASSEAIASASATSAGISETNAATSATNAALSETNASASEVAASASETSASISAANSATSATNAETSYQNTLAIYGSSVDIQNAVNSALSSAAAAAISEANAASSASAASTSETNAQTYSNNAALSAIAAGNSETAAATSASSALASKQAAAISETNAAGSATSANTSAVSASNSAINASTSASSASASATAASTSETNAASSAVSASNSATAASTSETNASASAVNASTSESNAASSAASAASDLLAIQIIYDNFDDRYLGNKASDPTVDNDGNPLLVGAIYFNTTVNETRFYNGSIWESPEATATQAASSAQTSATSAATSATNAANSASAASTSEVNAGASASNAATSAANASTSESNAATSELNASNSATSASSSATSASSSATSASSSASAAATSETNAANSATSAASSETASSGSALDAEDSNLEAQAWATKTTGVVNSYIDGIEQADGIEYSAKKYSIDASSSASNASTSESNANASATAASTSAANSATSASNSQASADAASLSESNAATSATNADSSANSASVSATSASTSASNALTSANNADTSEAMAEEWASKTEDIEITGNPGKYSALHHASKAAVSASSASTSASNASASETSASTSASSAATSATSASSSASAASTSETNASTFASNAFTSANNAATSESNASTSATAAATSATNADGSEALAQEWSSKAEDIAITGNPGMFSALHHSAKSADSATSAAGSASTATTQAGISTTKATEASNSASAASTSASNAALSESNASTSASNASTSETNAASSASSASTSATSASGSATAASTSASNADASESLAAEWASKAENLEITGNIGKFSALHHSAKAEDSAISASSSASTATTQANTATTKASEASTSASNALASKNAAALSESNAASSATSASTSASNASTSETNASNSATSASGSASSASTSATNASTSASNAATSETNAATSASTAANHLAAIEVIYDNFDDRYLGAFATDPTLDNDGQPLQIGAMYFNTASNDTKFYNGTAWENPELTTSQAASQAQASATAAATSETNAANSATSASTSASSASASASSASTSETNAATSASSASTSASNASTSETNAASSATSASGSATSASGSATNAATSESNAATSATSASTSETKAQQWAENPENIEVEIGQYSALHHAAKAATDAASASSSASSATSSASSASTSATNAASSASAASTSASNASTSETNAASSASAASTSASSAATSATTAGGHATTVTNLYNDFSDKYLGPKASDPTLDNDGDPLVTGAVYWNTTANALRIYDGAVWQVGAFDSSGVVVTFNDRNGAVTLLQSDVNTAIGRDTAADGSKLDGIEAGATADQTKADIDALGINATQLDGVDSAQFLRSDQNDSFGGSLLTIANGDIKFGTGLTGFVNPAGNDLLRTSTADGGNASVIGNAHGKTYFDSSLDPVVRLGVGQTTHTLYHTGNLSKATIDALNVDADTLDGYDSTYFEPAFAKNTAFNKNFAGSGIATTVARSDHNHDSVYEPADINILKSGHIGSTVQGYNANTVIDGSYVHTDNNYTTTEKSKLAGIESGATADQTKADIDALGINAATLDGLDSTDLTPLYRAITDVANIDTPGSTYIFAHDDSSFPGGTKPPNSSNALGIISMHTHSGNYTTQLGLSTSTNELFLRSDNNSGTFGTWQRIYGQNNLSKTVIDALNVDSDTLDGQHGDFYRSVDNHTEGVTNKLFTAVEKTKLAGIADNANNYTLPVAGVALGGVKTGGDVTIDGTGIITVNDDSHNHVISNIDGLQTALDGKVDDGQVLTNVPAGAVFTDTTYTDVEIKTKYEANLDTNAYTDAEKTKLSGIADSANNYTLPIAGLALGGIKEGGDILIDANGIVTVNDDSHNHTIANIDGLQTALDGKVDDGQVLTNVPAGAVFTDTTYSNADIKTMYEANLNTNAFTDADQSKLSGIEANATADQTGAEIKTAYESQADTNAFTDAEKTKLGTIADNANNYSLPIATNLVLGGVKEGGDILIDAAGVMTVVDDSHNHVIANVDGLQTALNGKSDVGHDHNADYVSKVSNQALHATDAFSITGNILYLNKADGTNESVDLSIYLDDTNLSRITSGTYVTDEPSPGDKNLKFVREDLSVFYVDASMFFDDTNLVTSVAGRAGAVTLTKADVGLSNVDNTSDLAKPISTATQTALNGKVDDGQVLTNVPAGAVFTDTTYTDAEIKTKYENNLNTNAYTDAEKSKLAGIASGAEVNIQSDWNAISGDAYILNKPTINGTNWDSAYTHSIAAHAPADADNTAANETSHADVVVDGDFTSTGLMKRGATAGSYSVVADNSTNWDTAYTHSQTAHAPSNADNTAANETSHADVVVDGDFASQGIMLRGATAGTYSILTDNSSNWNTAFSWGDHGAAGYEPGFSKNTAFNKNFGTTIGTVAQGNDSRIINGQTAFGWGDHAGLYETIDANITREGNTFNGISQLVKTDGTGKLPALDGSNLTNVSTVASIEDLTDVNTMTPTDGQVLTWDNVNSRWDAADSAGGSDSVTPFNHTASAGQTVFAVTYSNVNAVAVYINGIRATHGVEYNLSGGNTLTLTDAATAGTTVNGLVFTTSDLYIAPTPINNNPKATVNNQTVFAATYTPNRVEVSVNGILLHPDEYTATNGTSVTLNQGVDIGTWVRVFSNDDTAIPGTIVWGNVTATPTTLAGYGITDGAGSGIDADTVDGREGADIPALKGTASAYGGAKFSLSGTTLTITTT